MGELRELAERYRWEVDRTPSVEFLIGPAAQQSAGSPRRVGEEGARMRIVDFGSVDHRWVPRDVRTALLGGRRVRASNGTDLTVIRLRCTGPGGCRMSAVPTGGARGDGPVAEFATILTMDWLAESAREAKGDTPASWASRHALGLAARLNGWMGERGRARLCEGMTRLRAGFAPGVGTHRG